MVEGRSLVILRIVVQSSFLLWCKAKEELDRILFGEALRFSIKSVDTRFYPVSPARGRKGTKRQANLLGHTAEYWRSNPRENESVMMILLLSEIFLLHIRMISCTVYQVRIS
jgi:hypothetical protein